MVEAPTTEPATKAQSPLAAAFASGRTSSSGRMAAREELDMLLSASLGWLALYQLRFGDLTSLPLCTAREKVGCLPEVHGKPQDSYQFTCTTLEPWRRREGRGAEKQLVRARLGKGMEEGL